MGGPEGRDQAVGRRLHCVHTLVEAACTWLVVACWALWGGGLGIATWAVAKPPMREPRASSAALLLCCPLSSCPRAAIVAAGPLHAPSAGRLSTRPPCMPRMRSVPRRSSPTVPSTRQPRWAVRACASGLCSSCGSQGVLVQQHGCRCIAAGDDACAKPACRILCQLPPVLLRCPLPPLSWLLCPGSSG